MERFLGKKIYGQKVAIEGQELKHLKVKRIKAGELLEVLTQEGWFLCKFEGFQKDLGICQIVERIEYTPRLPTITLYQCTPVHLKTMEDVIVGVSQAGAHRLVPVISERSFRDKKTILEKLPRWEKLSLESLKQCGRREPLIVDHPVELSKLETTSDLNLVLDNYQEGLKIKDLRLEGVKSISLVVGPEGGFSSKEVQMLKDKGFISLRLEPYTYRLEAASLVAVAILTNLV